MTQGARRAVDVARRLDRHWWVLIIAIFVGSEIGLTIWAQLSDGPTLLARANKADRSDVYSSLSSSSGALLGFTIAAIAVLVAFGAPASPGPREANLIAARRKLVAVLLVTAAFLGSTLTLSTIALGVDRAAPGHEWLEHLTLAAAGASAIGLAVGGLGFTLAILERRS
jgi:hypothetical protein